MRKCPTFSHRKETNMKRILKICTLLLCAFLIAVGSHIYTITHLTIETNDHSDFGVVTCLGHEWFYEVNLAYR